MSSNATLAQQYFQQACTLVSDLETRISSLQNLFSLLLRDGEVTSLVGLYFDQLLELGQQEPSMEIKSALVDFFKILSLKKMGERSLENAHPVQHDTQC